MLQLSFPGFQVVDTEVSDFRVCITIEGDGESQPCPQCGTESGRVHSSYVRRPRDLPILGRRVVLQVTVRRFRCLSLTCHRRTFCEPLGPLAAPKAQRTARMTTALQALILKLSSRSGAELAAGFGIQTSPRTLLRTVDRSDRPVPSPRVLGVDEFAIRRGHTYATLLVDLESGRPIDVLPDRKADPLVKWLRHHPGVQVIARDRASAYAEAARVGAPQAIQVADRFHLVRNVTDALQEVVDRKAWQLPVPTPPPDSPAEVAGPLPEVSAPNRTPSQREQMAASAERRQRRWEEIQRLHASGKSLRAICQATGLSRATIRKYAQSTGIPERAARPPVPRKLDPFFEYLQGRWQAGERNGAKLLKELMARGYTGSPSQLRVHLAGWRKGASESAPTRSTSRMTPWKEIRWTILRPREHLDPKELNELAQVLELNPALAVAYNLVQSFRRLLRERCSSDLDPWLNAANTSGHAAFQRLARTLRADRQAVLAGVQLPWSTGPVEGHNTRVKLLKRLRYGRASLQLLRARILCVA